MSLIMNEGERIVFDEKQVQDIIKSCVSKVLDVNTKYNHTQVSNWVSTIVESVIETLSSLYGGQITSAPPELRSVSSTTSELKDTVSSIEPEGDKQKNKLENQPFKYIVTAVIMQNNGAGFHTATSCLWDSCDGMVTDKLEGKHLYCITTAYAIAL